jgi:BirA family biotin operon repressor/biotin-[acetyl-CoA-carboxylase] ligase
MDEVFPPSWRRELNSADAIRVGLGTRIIGQTVYFWPAINSTNDELKRLAEEGAPEGALAITDEQLAGRGRLERKWVAPAGSSLLMSLLFRPSFLAPSQVQQLTMICSLAAADAVYEITGLRTALKWPNDLLLEGKKLAGLLTELGFAHTFLESDAGRSPPDRPEGEHLGRDNTLAWVVVGVGLNVNVDFGSGAFRRDWPDLAGGAVSLAMVLGRPVPRLQLLQSYLSGVETRYEALRSGASPHQEWVERLATIGQQVSVRAPDGVYRGVAESVDETGALLLRQPDGQRKRLLTGDVTLRI